jgi:NAD(P)-dependent dehydrogenase (short-subunit alcohol dehydrogenase family)
METGGNAIVVGVGAHAGLGAALCRRFGKEGRRVFVAGRTKAKVDAVATEIRAAGGDAIAVECDTTREADVARLFDEAARAPGLLEIVVYNAGNNALTPLLELDAAKVEELWRIGCFGGFLVGREAARRMASVGSGTIVFTGATGSVRGKPPFYAFAMAKAGLRALAQAMARDFGPQGIHVAHVIVDGGIDGDRLNTVFPGFKDAKGEGGMLDIDAIADAYWFLHRQHRSAWTHELDLRPFKEPF